MRVVFDTNVLISAILSKNGLPNKAVRRAAKNTTVISCLEAIEELEEKLAEPKFSPYLSKDERGKELGAY